MKKTLIGILFSLTCLSAFTQTDSAYHYFNQSKEALSQADTTQFYNLTQKALRIHPYHPTLVYQGALASAMLNKEQEAFRYLRRALHMNGNIDLSRNEFKQLIEKAEFESLKNLQRALLKPVIQSDTAFVIHDKTLHLESISGTGDRFFCGSIHKRKIIEVDTKGNFKDFVPSAQDGLTSVFGVRADRKRNVLWACSSPMQEGENFDSTARSAVFCYNLKTRKLLGKFAPLADKPSVFGDLTIDGNGNVFVSDSKNNIIYRVNEKSKVLEEFFKSSEFWNVQGIATDSDSKNLFIADYIKGLYKLELHSKKLIRLQEKFDVSTKSIDGLSFYNHSLICIQNGIFPMRVTQYFLDEKQEQLTRYRNLDSNHPAFNEPTIGFVDGDTFYYVANSLWSGYEDGKLKPEEQLQDVVILKADLKSIQ